jgi:hypothetical protein
MTPFASLPMYNFPEMRSANAQFWGALRRLLLEAGLGDVPETLVFERGPVPARLEAEMLFSQTCGYRSKQCLRARPCGSAHQSMTCLAARARRTARSLLFGRISRRGASTTYEAPSSY